MAALQNRTPKVLTKTNKALSKSILEFFTNNFDRGGYEPGKTFVPWARRKYQLNHELLHNTGQLRNSFRIEKADSGEISITNSADYAKYVNDGTDDTPARPILYTSKEIEDMITKEMTDAIKNMFKF